MLPAPCNDAVQSGDTDIPSQGPPPATLSAPRPPAAEVSTIVRNVATASCHRGCIVVHSRQNKCFLPAARRRFPQICPPRNLHHSLSVSLPPPRSVSHAYHNRYFRSRDRSHFLAGTRHALSPAVRRVRPPQRVRFARQISQPVHHKRREINRKAEENGNRLAVSGFASTHRETSSAGAPPERRAITQNWSSAMRGISETIASKFMRNVHAQRSCATGIVWRAIGGASRRSNRRSTGQCMD